jgi:hypothetical protein
MPALAFIELSSYSRSKRGLLEVPWDGHCGICSALRVNYVTVCWWCPRCPGGDEDESEGRVEEALFLGACFLDLIDNLIFKCLP